MARGAVGGGLRVGQRQPLEERETSGRAVGGRIAAPAHRLPRRPYRRTRARRTAMAAARAGRRLALIFTRRGTKLRPISCRPMRRNERRLYDEAKAAPEGGSEEGRWARPPGRRVREAGSGRGHPSGWWSATGPRDPTDLDGAG